MEKVVLITRAAGGIGFSTVEAFENRGWKVWVGYRSKIPDEAGKFSSVNWISLDVTTMNKLKMPSTLLDFFRNCNPVPLPALSRLVACLESALLPV